MKNHVFFSTQRTKVHWLFLTLSAYHRIANTSMFESNIVLYRVKKRLKFRKICFRQKLNDISRGIKILRSELRPPPHFRLVNFHNTWTSIVNNVFDCFLMLIFASWFKLDACHFFNFFKSLKNQILSTLFPKCISKNSSIYFWALKTK